MDTYRRQFIRDFVSYTTWLLGLNDNDVEVAYEFPSPQLCTPKQLRKLRIDTDGFLIDIVNSMAPERVGYVVPDRVWRIMSEILATLPGFQLFSPLTYVDSVPDYYYASDHELLCKTFGQGSSPDQAGTRWDPIALDFDSFRGYATKYLMALLSQALQAYGIHSHPSLAARDLVFADEPED